MGELDGFMRRTTNSLSFSSPRGDWANILFKITHEKVGVGRCHFSAHCCAVYASKGSLFHVVVFAFNKFYFSR